MEPATAGTQVLAVDIVAWSRPDGVVVTWPFFKYYLSSIHCVEDFAIEKFIAEVRVKFLAIQIRPKNTPLKQSPNGCLPRVLGQDLGGFKSDTCVSTV